MIASDTLRSALPVVLNDTEVQWLLSSPEALNLVIAEFDRLEREETEGRASEAVLRALRNRRAEFVQLKAHVLKESSPQSTSSGEAGGESQSKEGASSVSDATLGILSAIARQELFIETLETRNSDSLDFYNLSVWGVRRALERAFEAGCQHAEKSQL